MLNEDTDHTIGTADNDTLYCHSVSYEQSGILPPARRTGMNSTVPHRHYESEEAAGPTEAWTLALQALAEDDFERAFKLVLNSNDDLYLLRLMYKTGPDYYRLLDENTSLRLFSRVVAIAKSQFLDDLTLDFFFEACDCGLAAQADGETIESMILVLECMESPRGDPKLLHIVLDYLKDLKTRK